ncbi:SAM-dependent methyltransferase [Spirillospora sp. CA-294931]|uniref:SAM-dependent methyltransferase n=1 Tax=Spirillospora sp. CA-294931 TaxID=3240042 RepID=UPI003D8DAFAB
MELPSELDVSAPNVARMYDYWLGGKDNFEADREAAEKVLLIAPEARLMAVENRAFIGRAIEHVVGGMGVRQIIDIGAGLPTQRNVHEVAQEVAPGTRVVYADYDPVVNAHARALLGKSDDVRVFDADVRELDAFLDDPGLRGFIDLARPVLVLITAVFHFITDEEGPGGILARLREALPEGSYLGLSHSTLDSGPDAAAKIAKLYEGASAPAILRTREEIRALFAGFELLEPGLVYTAEWRRTTPLTQNPAKAWMLAGVGQR